MAPYTTYRDCSRHRRACSPLDNGGIVANTRLCGVRSRNSSNSEKYICASQDFIIHANRSPRFFFSRFFQFQMKHLVFDTTQFHWQSRSNRQRDGKRKYKSLKFTFECVGRMQSAIIENATGPRPRQPANRPAKSPCTIS